MGPLQQHPEGPTRGAQKRQPSWFRISLDDSKDLLNIIQTFGQARLENFCINISQPKTINILILICLVSWAPFTSTPKSRLAAPRKRQPSWFRINLDDSLDLLKYYSNLQPGPPEEFLH
jgi:hypothetical protein